MKKLLASLTLGLAFVGTAQATQNAYFLVKNNTAHDIKVQAGSSETAAIDFKEIKVAPGQEERFTLSPLQYHRDPSAKVTEKQSIYKDKASFQMQAITGSNSNEFKQIDFSVEDFSERNVEWSNVYGYRTLYYGIADKQFDTYCAFSGKNGIGNCWFKQPGTIIYDYQDINGKTKMFVYEDIYNVVTNAQEFKFRGEYLVSDLKGDVIPQVAQSGISPWGK